MVKLVILLVLFISTQALNFQLMGNKQFCMRFEGDKTYTLQYVISGNQDKNVLCAITQHQTVILQKQGVSQYQFSHQYHGDQPVNVCFASTDGQQKQVSFDFYESNDPIRKMIDKKDVSLVQAALAQSYQQMTAISRNQQYQIERDQKHKINLEDSESKIKWAGIIKIIFLLGSALIQLWIMKGFFKSSNPYQPVQQV